MFIPLTAGPRCSHITHYKFETSVSGHDTNSEQKKIRVSTRNIHSKKKNFLFFFHLNAQIEHKVVVIPASGRNQVLSHVTWCVNCSPHWVNLSPDSADTATFENIFHFLVRTRPASREVPRKKKTTYWKFLTFFSPPQKHHQNGFRQICYQDLCLLFEIPNSFP